MHTQSSRCCKEVLIATAVVPAAYLPLTAAASAAVGSITLGRMTSDGQPPQKKQKKERPVLVEVQADQDHPGNSKFARALGSTDYLTREKGVHALTLWLTRKADLVEADLVKIWKGLFYCFWHSDKAPVQLELAERLAGILPQLPQEGAFLFFAVFIRTMRREWFGIDRLRLDKYLLLIRKFISQALACLQKATWNSQLLGRYTDFLQQEVLLPADHVSAAGLAFHVGDLLVSELRSVTGGTPLPAAALATLLAPFAVALQKAADQAALVRTREGVWDALMDDLLAEAEGTVDDGDDDDGGAASSSSRGYLALLDVPQLAATLFDMGAQPGTLARNRKALYDLSAALEKAHRKRQKRAEEQAAAVGARSGGGSAKAGKVGKQAAAAAAKGPSAANGHAAAAPAGPAAASAPAPADGAKLSKKQQRAAAAAAAVALEVSEQAQAAAASAGAALAAGTKRKASALAMCGTADSTAAAGPSAQAAAGAMGHHAAEQQGPHKKKPSAAAGTASPAAALGAAAGNVQAGAQAKHKEPTSGAKAAFRAAIATAGAGAASPAAGFTASGTKPLQQQQQQRAGTAAPLAAAATPKSALKPSAGQPAAASQQQQQQQGQPGQSTTISGKKRKHDAAGSKFATPEPSAAPRAAVGRGTGENASSKKKGVRINLQHNLYFEAGGPVPAPDIRTPPTARSKGGILKKSAAARDTRKAPGSAPAKLSGAAQAQQQQQQGSQRRTMQNNTKSAQKAGLDRPTPKSAQRPSAALFF